MKYTPTDLEQFHIHINELLEKKFIRKSLSKHSSPAFIVNKHREQKIGKQEW